MTLEVITGPMFSGKSTELIRAVKREGYAKKKIGVFKPSLDNRYSEDNVVTHDGLKYPTFVIPTTDDGTNQIYDIVKRESLDVIGIDEIQFFPKNIINIIEKLADEKIQVIVTGLNMNFRGEPFEVMSTILPRADNIRHLSAVCATCGGRGTRTQRLIDGKPSPESNPTTASLGAESG